MLRILTENQFAEIFTEVSETVADEFYPKGQLDGKGRRNRRSEYLRDQGVLYSRLLDALKEPGI